MYARPYGPRRDCICRLMLDPSNKIPRVMHVRLRGLAIQTWCYPGFFTKSARQGDNLDPLARLLITRQMALSGSSPLNTGCAGPYFEYRSFCEETVGLGEILPCSEMPPKSTQDNMVPEAKGIKYDECEMALFRAKLSYHATIDERMASQNSNLTSIAEAQARILKGWEIQMQGTKDLAGKNGGRSESDKRAMAQYAWRYTALENAATKTTGKG
ncbi:uncharacterized protein N7487_002746 [Penicillium crustosum]|nr:uncharacterized protein N7487_002746 [Penicillium crustosum]KAJ5419196.1 hypothetical protein N7487_002746 [Penicillium crustosum]